MHSPRSARRVAALVSAVVLSVTLSACGADAEVSPTPSTSVSASDTASPTASATPAPTVPVSSDLEGIGVSGLFGASATATIPAPFAIDESRWKAITPGNGAVVPEGGTVEIHYAGYNGRTGVLFESSFERGQSAVMPLGQVIPGFAKGLQGRTVGDRVLIAMPGSDGYDAAGGQPTIGIEVGDTLVFVVDILASQLSGPSGTPVAPPPGLPAVAEENGRPVVTIDRAATPPAELVVQTLIEGSGRTVGETDAVMVHYRTWSWKTGAMIEDKFDTPDSGAIAETIPAWRTGVVGKKVGSRIMIIAPPSESYPEGNNNPPVTKGDTLVYVVDLLFTAPLG